MYRDILIGVAVFGLLCLAHQQQRNINKLERSRDAYASMLGACLEGQALWDNLNKHAYFCSATKVAGL